MSGLSYKQVKLGQKDLSIEAGPVHVYITRLYDYSGQEYISVEVGPYAQEKQRGYKVYDYTHRGLENKVLLGDGGGVMLAIGPETKKEGSA